MSEADKLLDELGYEREYLEHIDYWQSKTDKFISFRNDKSIAIFNAYDGFESIDMQELQAINMKVEELRMDIAETKRNIEYWENEVQQALKENDIMKAVGCRILANNLRKDIGESEI